MSRRPAERGGGEPAPDPRWCLRARGWDPATARHFEGLFTQGSGYLHVRGSLEEPVAGAPQNADPLRRPGNVTAERFAATPAKWGTFVPGVFADHPLLGHEMVNLPFFLGWTLEVEGEVLDVTTATLAAHERVLDLRDGVLTRTLRWCARAGAIVEAELARFASAARPHLVAQRLRLAADRDVAVVVTSFVDAGVRTNGFDHFPDAVCAIEGEGDVVCRLATNGGDEVEIRSRLCGEAVAAGTERAGRRAGARARLALAGGAPQRVLEKRTALVTSRDLAPASTAGVLAAAAPLSWEELRAETQAVWRERWRRCAVEVDGDPESRLALRAALHHLLRSHVPGDDRVAIDAKAAAGEAYYGRFFWDTEMFLLPFFLYTDPPKARTLVAFRLRTLEGARENARASGFRGARYAWESSTTGREQCPAWPYNEEEVHVTADVVHGFAHYARAAEPGFLRGPAAEAIVETARFWADRVTVDAAGVPHLDGVLGPDEYTPTTADNAYTNRLAAFALELAAAVGEAGGASEAERARFAAIARDLPIHRAAGGTLVLQCAGFDALADARLDEIWPDRSVPLARTVDLERLYPLRVLKQADVLMLMALFPGEFSDEEVRAAWDYYEPITTHDSSLSAGVHGLIAGRLGLADAAWSFWRRGRDVDLDPTHGGAAEGIHAANAGATWMAAVMGFAGLANAMASEVLTLAPRLPAAWGRLAFPLVWRGTPVFVEITREGTAATNRGAAPILVRVAGEERTAAPGETVRFAHAAGPVQRLGAVLLDLDGVLVTTDRLHFAAWSRLAAREGIPFDWETNHRLRGVSRRESLEIVLERAERAYSEAEKEKMLAFKNGLYVESLGGLTPADVLPGARELLEELRGTGIPAAIVSASRNAALILARTDLAGRAAVLVDGGDVERSKPDPEAFLLAARRLGVDPAACLVVEDAPAGLEAARRAGMASLAVGDRRRHPEALRVVVGLDELSLADLRAMVVG
ncbi:MAG: beta-phosphoglucomutase [Planctomycetota bacterium]